MRYSEFPYAETIKGMKIWKNLKNQFSVIALHYTADPEKDPSRKGKVWYENERRGTPKDIWEKEYEINFSSKSGKLIFGPDYCDFDPNIHFINSWDVPGYQNMELLVGMDFGQSNPNATVVAAWSKHNVLYIVDEYYKPAIPSIASKDMFQKFAYLMGETEDSILEKSIDERRSLCDSVFQIKVIDPTTRAKNRTKHVEGIEIPYSIIEEFFDNGWDFEKGNNDFQAGITRIREYLRVDENKRSKIYIFQDKCPNLCRELKKYKYKEQTEKQEKTKNSSEEPMTKGIHAIDALRYLIMTRPITPTEAPKELTFIQRDIYNIMHPKSNEDLWNRD